MIPNKRYMLVQISCIECGVSSYPVGLYNTLEDARKAREARSSTWDSEGGDGYVEIWEVIKDDTTWDSVEWKDVIKEEK